MIYMQKNESIIPTSEEVKRTELVTILSGLIRKYVARRNNGVRENNETPHSLK